MNGSHKNSEDEGYLVKIVTTEPSNFKALFSILKENNISEANIVITDNNLEILEMDPSHNVVVHVQLNKEAFSHFYCKEPIKVGVDCVNLMKILKNICSKDTLTIYVVDTNNQIEHAGGDIDVSMSFGFLIENAEKGQTNTLSIGTIDVNEHNMSVPQLDYPYHIQLPASDLQSIVTSLKNMGGEVVKLLFHKNTLHFSTKGDIGTSEITRSQTAKEDISIKIYENGDESIIEIYVKLEKIAEFTKCSVLSTFVTIYLKNDYPVFFEYDVGSLGFIRFGCSPYVKQE